MDNKINKISPTCRLRLEIQGYQNYSDKELNDYKYGIRLAYALCAALVASGLLLGNVILLMIAAAVAFIGIFPPYHPVDYLYNYVIRHIFGKPKLPRRTNQGRFACSIAAAWLAITIYFFYNDYIIISYMFGGTLLTLAILVSTTDICIPSMIYNALFKNTVKEGSPQS